MTTRSLNACWYTYWVAGVSISLSILISVISVCAPARRNTCCMSIESVLGLLGCAWWIAAGVTDLVFAQEANDANVPYEECRMVSWILGFTNAALFLLSFLSSFFSCVKLCGRKGELDM
jgi:hypothetical protein